MDSNSFLLLYFYFKWTSIPVERMTENTPYLDVLVKILPHLLSLSPQPPESTFADIKTSVFRTRTRVYKITILLPQEINLA
jgi:hypothetical protein